MGVKGLWTVLGPVKEVVPVSSLRGKVLAVDLAIWVVQSETVTHNEYEGIYLRQMFYKINHLLEHGVGIVIVTDGRAPHLKALTIARRLGVDLDRNNKVIQRRRFMKIMRECELLAQSLGLTVLKGAFEAEAAAAKLQLDGLVDGVVTTDGDAFLYGARQVYRNVLVTEKHCEVYNMSRVETELGLSRDDLIGMGILNGCDYNPDGISGLGRTTVLNYILSRDRTRTVTEELISWCEQVTEIRAKYQQLQGIKCKPHCSACRHQGSKKDHANHGCTCCRTTSGCLPNSAPCNCTKHVAQRLLSSPHMLCCVKLVSQANVATVPVKQIVAEFSNNRSNDSVDPQWELPPCTAFVEYMHDKLQWRKQTSAQKFSHIAALYHVSQNLTFAKTYPIMENQTLKFNHILKRRRKDKVDMYELEYSVLDENLKALLEFDVVYAKLGAEFVEMLLPGAVKEFREREKQFTRKKKENIPIYERYPVKKPTPTNPPHPPLSVRPTTARQKTRGTTKKVEKLTDSLSSLQLSDDPLPLRDISATCVNSKGGGDETEEEEYRGGGGGGETDPAPSSDEEYVPLSQRLALRRAKSAKATSSSRERECVLHTPSSLSSLDSPPSVVTDENHAIEAADKIITADADDNIFSGSETDGYIDSDVQLLPHNFMDEYLDLSREEILEISREETVTHEDGRVEDETRRCEVDVDLSANVGRGRSISRENSETSLLATESVDSEEYKQLIEGKEYHTLFFATPAKPAEPEHVSDVSEYTGNDVSVAESHDVQLGDEMDNQSNETHRYKEDDTAKSPTSNEGNIAVERVQDVVLEDTPNTQSSNSLPKPTISGNSTHQPTDNSDLDDSLDISNLRRTGECKSRDVSVLSGGFSPKTPPSGKMECDTEKLECDTEKMECDPETMDADPRDMELSQSQDINSSADNSQQINKSEFDPDSSVEVVDTKPGTTPLPDIAEELVESVISDSIYELTLDSIVSFSPTQPSSIEGSTMELSIGDPGTEPGHYDTPGHYAGTILVPDTPVIPSKTGSRLFNGGLDQKSDNEVNGAAVLGPISTTQRPLALSRDLIVLPNDKTLPSIPPSHTSHTTHTSHTSNTPPSPEVVVFSQPHLPPDISFFEPRLEVSTPVWHKPPLSDIHMTSTPKGKDKGSAVLGEVQTVMTSPLPGIQSEVVEFENRVFDLNITDLLEKTSNE